MGEPYHRVSSLADIAESRPTFLAIGVFDGVHRGHQEILRNMSQSARSAGARSAALTFYPHPGKIISGRQGPLYLCSLEDRVHLIADQGIELIITHTFDEKVRKTGAREFVEQLCKHLGLSELWGGVFGLGYNREGDLPFLRQLGKEMDFTVRQFLGIVEWHGEPISSSRVRHYLGDGLVEDAAACLSRPYRLRGRVVHGDGRGRAIGVPTANLAVWEEQVLPSSGVYATYAWLGGRRYASATNIGVRPTVNGRNLIVETHVIDFDSDLYGREITLDFISRIRDEQKFPGLDALVSQIKADISQVRNRLQPEH